MRESQVSLTTFHSKNHDQLCVIDSWSPLFILETGISRSFCGIDEDHPNENKTQGRTSHLFHSGSSRWSATVPWVWQRFRHSLEWTERPGCGLMEALSVGSRVDQSCAHVPQSRSKSGSLCVALNWKWGQMLGSWWSLTAFWAMVQRLCTGFQAGHH